QEFPRLQVPDPGSFLRAPGGQVSAVGRKGDVIDITLQFIPQAARALALRRHVPGQDPADLAASVPVIVPATGEGAAVRREEGALSPAPGVAELPLEFPGTGVEDLHGELAVGRDDEPAVWCERHRAG